MSNRLCHRDREAKAVARRLEYVAYKPKLWALVETRLEEVREARRLTPFERVRFRHWLFWKQGGALCGYCGISLPLDCLTIDHIQPRSKGGAVRDINNMVLACLGCNRAKGNSWKDYTTF